MNTRNTLIGKTPVWVAVGSAALASAALGQSRPHPLDLSVGHSEQGRITPSFIVGMNETTDPLRLIIGGTDKSDGTGLSGADIGGGEFAGAARLLLGDGVALPGFADLERSPFARDGTLVPMTADGSAPHFVSGTTASGTIPAPGTLLLIGVGIAIGRTRRR